MAKIAQQGPVGAVTAQQAHTSGAPARTVAGIAVVALTFAIGGRLFWRWC